MAGILGLTPGATKKSEGNLSNVFNFALPTSEAGYTAGASDQSAAATYWKSLVSGSRTSLMANAAPEINAVNAASDASRKETAATGTARGGGVNAANRTAGDNTTAQITNALFAVRPKAAQQLGQTGAAETSSATNLLGLGTNATAAAGDQGLSQEQIAQNSIGQDAIASLAQPLVGKATDKFSEALNWLI